MLQKTRGIVLHSIKYGETGLVVTLYTEVYGRVSFFMQGVRGKKTARKANILQPLFLLDIEVDYKPGRDLQRAKEFKIDVQYTKIPYDPIKSSQAFFLSELVNKVLCEEEQRPQLFDFLYNSFQILDLMEKEFADFHLVFMVQFSRYLGFEPTSNHSEQNIYFDLIAGLFTDTQPIHPHFLNQADSLLFSRLLKINFQNYENLQINRFARQRLLTQLLDYYSLHIGINLKLKSLDVFQQLFE